MNNQTQEPAFPAAPNPNYTDDAFLGQRGMSLRDYFAAKALQGMLSNAEGNRQANEQFWAKLAYAQADAMLDARNK